jgi:heme-degrading monooxygenase HmoA
VLDGAAGRGHDGAMLIVAGHLELEPDDRDAFVADAVTSVELARGTPGCLDFSVSPDPVDPTRVNVLERWESADALLGFRGNGPDDGVADRVVEFHLDEYEVTVARLPQEFSSSDQVHGQA